MDHGGGIASGPFAADELRASHTELPLPVRLDPATDEAIDSYLERLAAANHLNGPAVLRRAGADRSTYLPITLAAETLAQLATVSVQPPQVLKQGVLASHAGVTITTDLDAGWRHAGRAWAPGRRSQICPACLATDNAWRITWRHPWVAVCVEHRIWLHAVCPTCASPFRSQRHSALRPGEAKPGSCGNPAGARGRTCSQDLNALPRILVPASVLESQRRIRTAIHHRSIAILAGAVSGEEYLAELKALAVLLLHLACQPAADQLATWAHAARGDRDRSPGGRGARWALAPPVDPVLRGHALAAADHILAAHGTEQAAEELEPWLDLLTLTASEGQLGWLADHTTATPQLTSLIMGATSTRRRLSTLLSGQPPTERPRIPQILPAELYAQHLLGLLDVTDGTGRLFASLCLVRLGRPGMTWRDAAIALDLPAQHGAKTARACSAGLLCSAATFIDAISATGAALGPGIDFPRRAQRVRHLATTARWHHAWARRYAPGSRASSRRYAITWLWSEYAAGHITTSPGWGATPNPAERSNYRRYAARLHADARDALRRLAEPGREDHVDQRS